MSELSSASQAILDAGAFAFWSAHGINAEGKCAAAVLRAAISQMNDCDGLLHGMELLQCIADELAPPQS